MTCTSLPLTSSQFYLFMASAAKDKADDKPMPISSKSRCKLQCATCGTWARVLDRTALAMADFIRQREAQKEKENKEGEAVVAKDEDRAPKTIKGENVATMEKECAATLLDEQSDDETPMLPSALEQSQSVLPRPFKRFKFEGV